jgi:glutathione S-transferase
VLKLWGRISSINVQKVLFLLEELGRPFERVDAGMQFGVVETPAYRMLNPNGLVPTIDDDGFVLWESNSILRYLCATDPSGRFFSKSPKERADLEKWMDWQLSVLAPPVATMFWGLVRAPGSRSPEEIATARKKADAAMQILENRLETCGWISGSAIGLADFAIAPFVHRWLDIPNTGLSFSKLAAYRGQILDLPSARRALPASSA